LTSSANPLFQFSGPFLGVHPNFSFATGVFVLELEDSPNSILNSSPPLAVKIFAASSRETCLTSFVLIFLASYATSATPCARSAQDNQDAESVQLSQVFDMDIVPDAIAFAHDGCLPVTERGLDVAWDLDAAFVDLATSDTVYRRLHYD
ncbi:hypothetical protein LTR82_018364, partial [Friedmanniomyces endolithicus]